MIDVKQAIFVSVRLQHRQILGRGGVTAFVIIACEGPSRYIVGRPGLETSRGRRSERRSSSDQSEMGGRGERRERDRAGWE